MPDASRPLPPAPPVQAPDGVLIPLCSSHDLQDGGRAVPFDVVYAGQTCRAFAIRYCGQVHAYLNRCAHVAMEMDWQPDRFFDDTGRWLLCATHGATYEPDTGACSSGPCRGGLVKIELLEQGGVVHWRSQYLFKPVEF
ncbi:MAG: Rieske 2Fe-2S domain-containing protein [Hydrogenophaga sp.]|nr:Rieske 2Fe-2S domain-containing protein [Hydrogenophaga sp.]